MSNLYDRNKKEGEKEPSLCGNIKMRQRDDANDGCYALLLMKERDRDHEWKFIPRCPRSCRMITIDLSRLIWNISMVRAVEGGNRRKRGGSQIIVSRRVKVKWLSRGTIDAEEKVVFEAYYS